MILQVLHACRRNRVQYVYAWPEITDEFNYINVLHRYMHVKFIWLQPCLAKVNCIGLLWNSQNVRMSVVCEVSRAFQKVIFYQSNIQISDFKILRYLSKYLV